MNSLVKTCENRIAQPIEREGFLNPFRFKAFTLTELIVVVTILAILGLISFIYIQGYTQEARDAKRLSDLRSLAGKVVIEQTKGANLEDLENREETIIVKINQEEKESNIGFLNREALREPSENFRDPLTGEEYKFAYSKGTINETESYSFIQFKGLKEVGGEDLFVGNYFQYANGDSPSLFEGAVANLPNPCSLGQYADISCREKYKSEVTIYPEDTYLSSTTFGSIAGSTLRNGGVLGANGKIYGIPHNSTKVLEIDPETRSLTQIGGPLGTNVNKRIGGILALNGSIYGIPDSSSKVLKINPETGTTEEFGNLGAGTAKRLGGALAPNGKIYGIPRNSSKVLKIDPENNSVEEIGDSSIIGTGDIKWAGGVLAPNGKIYGIPYHSSKILEINPENDSVRVFGNSTIIGDGNYKWNGGVLGLNGKIYGIPMDATTILEINPENDEVKTFGIPGKDTATKWEGGILAPNGKIYGAPRNNSKILEIDPENSTSRIAGSVPSGLWHGLVLAPNGKVYGIPITKNSASVLEISFSTDRELSIESLLGSYVNKY